MKSATPRVVFVDMPPFLAALLEEWVDEFTEPLPSEPIVFLNGDAPGVLERLAGIRMEHRFSPIIITTTLDRKEFVVDCLRRGVADVVEKPFRKDRIQQALRQVTLDSKRAPM